MWDHAVTAGNQLTDQMLIVVKAAHASVRKMGAARTNGVTAVARVDNLSCLVWGVVEAALTGVRAVSQPPSSHHVGVGWQVRATAIAVLPPARSFFPFEKSAQGQAGKWLSLGEDCSLETMLWRPSGVDTRAHRSWT